MFSYPTSFAHKSDDLIFNWTPMGLVKRKNQDEIAEIDIDTIMDVNFLFRIGHNTDLEA